MKRTTEEMEFMFYTCVYEIVNTINNKRYIGSTKDIRTRYTTHRSQLLKGQHKNKPLQTDVIYYGLINFDFNILEDGIKDNVRLDIEQKWIDKYDFEAELYNVISIVDNKSESDNVESNNITEDKDNDLVPKHANDNPNINNSLGFEIDKLPKAYKELYNQLPLLLDGNNKVSNANQFAAITNCSKTISLNVFSHAKALGMIEFINSDVNSYVYTGK